jgi:tripartite-type tricarboxylate transporter receptor subunit TctC
MNRRNFLIASACITSFKVSAREYALTNGPIKFVVAAPPGAAPDILARKIGESLGKRIGQSVIVENKVGARGMIGTDHVAKAPADGHTLIMGFASAFCVEPALNTKLPFDPIKDFSPVALVGTLSPAIVIRGNSTIKTLGELIEHAKKAPESINVGASTSTNILLAAMLEQAAGIKLYSVPYSSSGDARIDLLAGRIGIHFDPPASVLQHIKTGKVRVLAVFDAQRNPSLPDAPTVAECGLPSLTFTGWNGVLAPAGTPNEIIQMLNRQIREIVATNELATVLNSLGIDAADRSPAEFGQLIADSLLRFTEAADRAGLRA